MRIQHDKYFTPRWMVQQLLKYASIDGSVYEPCAGDDLAIAREFPVNRVTTNDLYAPAKYQMDATKEESWSSIIQSSGYVADWVITNPPFCCQQPIIQYAHKYARVGVAMLLRVTADEMVVSPEQRTRADWWADTPESLVIKMPRYSFAKSSKTGKWSVDSAYCQWFVWRKDGHAYDRPIIRLPADRIEGYYRTPKEGV
jgi:hypothetical protein